MLRSHLLYLFVLIGPFTCFGDEVPVSATCQLRSKELQTLYQGDQGDRKEIEAHLDKAWPKEAIQKIEKNDNDRRLRVAAIFAEGCIHSAADYVAAAMIYQHGTVPDHFYQTFIWSKRAVDLGDVKQKQLMALGIDRYLMNINQKQLFGSQAKKLNNDDVCWCLWPVERSFSEKLRSEYLGMTVKQKLAWVKEINGKNDCPVPECKVDAKPTLKGFVPGFW